MGDQIIQSAQDFRLKSLYSIDQLNYESLRAIVKTINDIRLSPEKFETRCQDKTLVIDFETASTRTILSTQLAWQRLGGNTIILNSGTTHNTSRSKGESVFDHYRTIADLGVDSVAIRCKKEFLPHELALKNPTVSWINCGDGDNEHPTQALLDFITIIQNLDINLHGLDVISQKTIAFVGDIKHSRTIHSLSKILELFNCKILFVAHDDLHNDEEYIDFAGVYNKYSLSELPEIIKEVDVVYATRNQFERFSDTNLQSYQSGLYDYLITPEMLEGYSTVIMHPLPRQKEISPLVDNLPNCAYFGTKGQIAVGIQMRMSLFSLINQPAS